MYPIAVLVTMVTLLPGHAGSATRVVKPAWMVMGQKTVLAVIRRYIFKVRAMRYVEVPRSFYSRIHLFLSCAFFPDQDQAQSVDKPIIDNNRRQSFPKPIEIDKEKSYDLD